MRGKSDRVQRSKYGRQTECGNQCTAEPAAAAATRCSQVLASSPSSSSSSLRGSTGISHRQSARATPAEIVFARIACNCKQLQAHPRSSPWPRLRKAFFEGAGASV